MVPIVDQLDHCMMCCNLVICSEKAGRKKTAAVEMKADVEMKAAVEKKAVGETKADVESEKLKVSETCVPPRYFSSHLISRMCEFARFSSQYKTVMHSLSIIRPCYDWNPPYI